MGKPLPRTSREPEQRLELPEVVPVYITYLTAMPENGQIAFRSDVYGRDIPRLALSGQ
jgi:L,D-transpeptidase YcbB